MVDIFLCQHLTHIASARGVAYHCGTAADKCYRLVACHLQTLHESQRHEMPCRQRIGSTVKADVKRGFSVVYHLSDVFFVRHLSNEPSCDKFFVNLHFFLLYICVVFVCVFVRREDVACTAR